MKHLLMILGLAGLLYIIFWAAPVNSDYKFVKAEIFGAEECEGFFMASMLIGPERVVTAVKRRVELAFEDTDAGWYQKKIRIASVVKRVKECVGE